MGEKLKGRPPRRAGMNVILYSSNSSRIEGRRFQLEVITQRAIDVCATRPRTYMYVCVWAMCLGVLWFQLYSPILLGGYTLFPDVYTICYNAPIKDIYIYTYIIYKGLV